MGAVETMEDFFEKLNGGDREGAVALMDEMTEMRVHVGDSVQMLRGVERVGGWFLRGDAGLRMIPGGIRDTGNTYEADLLVVRPGAPTQHIDATFRVEAGKITAINIAPALTGAAARRPPRDGAAAAARTASEGASAAEGSTISSGSATGMMISSPTPILFGFLIVSLFASRMLVHGHLELLGDLVERVALLDRVGLRRWATARA